MSESRDVILEAAETAARDSGLDALTVRQLARVTHYGKSTVHEAVGGVPQLVAELRRRAMGDLIATFNAPPQITSTHPDACALIPDRIADWVLANPAWAEVAFSETEVDGEEDWVHPIGHLLRDAFPDEVEQLEPRQLAVVAARGARMIAADIPAVIALGAVYGREILTSTVQSVYAGIETIIRLPTPAGNGAA